MKLARTGVQGGRCNKGHCQCQCNNHQPVTTEPAVGDGNGADDQAEFTVVGERKRGEQRGVGAQPEAGEQAEIQYHLEYHQHGQAQRHQQRCNVDGSGHANTQEETNQQQILEAEQLFRHLGSRWVRRQQRAQNQRTQVALYIENIEQCPATEGQ